VAINTTLLASSIGDGIVIPGYDKFTRWALRSLVLWRQFVDVFPQDVTNDAKVINLKRHNYLTVSATPTPLDEVTAASPTTSPQTTNVPVTILEQGLLMGRTTFLGDVAYIPVDPALGHQLATHMADSLDWLARVAFLAGTNRITSNAGVPDAAPVAVNTLVNGDVISARIIREAVKRLRKRNAVPFRGTNYAAVVSHDTSVDIQQETGTSNVWHSPHVNVDTAAIYNGYIGTFGGADFIETNRAFAALDGAASAAVHRSIFMGREAVAEAVVREPHVGLSPMVDLMNRGKNIYWYGSLGHALYRDEVVERVEHGVSSGVI
jgi:N4-gp56 family major capsid protein